MRTLSRILSKGRVGRVHCSTLRRRSHSQATTLMSCKTPGDPILIFHGITVWLHLHFNSISCDKNVSCVPPSQGTYKEKNCKVHGLAESSWHILKLPPSYDLWSKLSIPALLVIAITKDLVKQIIITYNLKCYHHKKNENTIYWHDTVSNIMCQLKQGVETRRF